MSETIYQGQSEELKLTVTDQDGTPVNITATDVKFIVLLLAQKSTSVAKWKYPTTSGFGQIEVLSVANGEYIIRLTPEQTAVINAGEALLEMKLIEPNANFASGFQESIFQKEFGIIEPTTIKGLS